MDLGADRYPLKVSVGSYHTCVTTNDESLVCWGGNDVFGQILWNGSMNSSIASTTVDQVTTIPLEVITSERNTLVVLTKSKKMKCWGDNMYGQIGDGTILTKRLTPTDIDIIS